MKKPLETHKVKKTKGNVSYHTHTHYNLDWMIKTFFIFLVVAICISSILGNIDHLVEKNEIVYENCVDACSKKNFIGIKVGSDDWRESPIVKEFDRTYCIKHCNELYLNLK